MENQPVKILIVDDDEVYRDVLKDAIGEENTELSLAASGEEALELLQSSPFDILITDLNMPGIDGLTLLKRARQLYPDILTLIITGYGSLESAVEAIRSGAYDYIQKPFRIDEVAVSTRNAVDRVRILRERQALLEELEKAYLRLQQLEGEARKKGTREESDDEGPWEDEQTLAKGRPRMVWVPGRTLPLDALQGPKDAMAQVLTDLERLKELRRERIVDEAEFERLKKIILRNVDGVR
ncbi:MAG: response regulator [Desulfosoma sp.]